MTSPSYHEQAKILTEWIDATNPNPVQVPADLVWMVATALGDQKIIWVSSDLSHAITNPTGEIVVFTEHTITRAIRNEDDVTLTVLRRSDIRSLTIAGTPAHRWGLRDTPSWPYQARVRATLVDGSTMTLPLGQGQLRKEACDRFVVFLPKLLTTVH